MTQQLFQRSVKVIVAADSGAGVSIEGLRTQLKIKKTLKKEPNSCELTIFNLADQTRSGMQSRGSRVQVEAGYVGATALIFSGPSLFIDHTHEGSNWVTKIQCADGERMYQQPVQGSFKPGTLVKDVFKATVNNLKDLDVAGAVQKAETALTGQFTQGYTQMGRAGTEIDNLLQGSGLTYSIQDGRLEILGLNETTTEAVVLLSPATGLIGTPAHGSPVEVKKTPQVLTVKSLMQPSLRPGGKCRVEWSEGKGNFRVLTVEHSGDTFGGDFYTVAELVPL